MYEKQIHAQGFVRVMGMDEAGRGAWAGPVAVGAACLPVNLPGASRLFADVRDSKEMTPRQRARVVETIKAHALAWGVGSASSTEIDTLGINPATRLAMQRALDDVCVRFPHFEPQCLLLDALIWPEMIGRVAQVSIVDGDARSLSIAAASIIAKTWRDEYMEDLDKELPHYGFALHKGYGTGAHQTALKLYGVSPLHRASYGPIRRLMGEQG